jgi:hypothetical protein
MDAAGLQGLFSQGNPFLAQMGEQAWNQDQQKAQQALLTAQGEEQRKQAMQPLEMAHKQATTGYNQALTQQITDKKAGELPANEKMTLAMSEYRKKMSDAQAAEEDTKMQRRMQYAEMAAKNGGVLPLEYLNQLDASERGHFANPKAVATTQQLAKAWYDTHPKTIEAKRKQEADLERARIMAGPGYARAASGGGKATGKAPDSPSKLMTYYTIKANESEAGSEEWNKYMSLAQNEWQKLEALRIQAAQAALTGKMDVPATVQSGTPQVRGAPVPSAMPGTKPQQWTPPAGWK